MENTALVDDIWIWHLSSPSVSEIKHHIHPPYKKRFIERTIRYIKDMTNALKITFHVKKRNVIKACFTVDDLFADYHNKEIIH